MLCLLSDVALIRSLEGQLSRLKGHGLLRKTSLLMLQFPTGSRVKGQILSDIELLLFVVIAFSDEQDRLL